MVMLPIPLYDNIFGNTGVSFYEELLYVCDFKPHEIRERGVYPISVYGGTARTPVWRWYSSVKLLWKQFGGGIAR